MTVEIAYFASMYYHVIINILLLSLCQSSFGTDCAPDLSSVGDSMITLSDELSDAYTAEERCEELGGYLVVTRDAGVNQTLIDVASQKYSTFNHADTQRVWIYYNQNNENIYKYSLSSNESSPWVSPQHLAHLWYIDLYTTSTATIPIHFCKADVEQKWTVGVGESCSGSGWGNDFVLYGLASPEAGYKAIYAYNQDKQPYSMRLTDVKDDIYKDFNIYRGTFYAPDIKRVWIYYNKDSDNLYKYSLSSNETSPWVSPQHLGHLWFIDLYNSSTDASIPIRFCEHHSPTEKWLVSVKDDCHDDWPEQFVLYGLASPEVGYKAIYAYDEGNLPGTSYSMRLTDVMDDNYNGFNKLKRTFYSPASDVFIGAQFNKTSKQWKWSDGEIATEFTDVNHTVCLQKVLDYGINQTSNRACSDSEKVYYSCQVKAEFKVEAIECDSTVLNISWNLLPLATKYNQTLKVDVTAVHEKETINHLTNEKQPFTILTGLSPSATYNITVTGSLGCSDMNDFESSFSHTMGPGSPNNITHPYVIKSADKCDVTFADPLPGESFDITVSENGLPGKVFESTLYCNTDICQIPFNVTDYAQGKTLEFTVEASNCEGITGTKSVAGYCVGLDHDAKPACAPTLTSSGEFVQTLSNDFTNASGAASKCSKLGGNLIQLKESDLSETFYERLNQKYLKDIQRIWVYHNKNDNQLYKYSFSNTPGDGWVVPSESESISYFDLYNRNNVGLDYLYFCKSGAKLSEKWQVSTEECLEGWKLWFYLFGKKQQSDGFKKIYMFSSNKTGSVKLNFMNKGGDDFEYVGQFAIPDINVYVGQVTNRRVGATQRVSCLTTRLQYDQGWEKIDGCDDDRPSYYACSVSPDLNYEHVPCNSTRMRITWNDNLFNLNDLLPEIDEIKFNLGISTEGISDVQNVSYSELEENITGFEPRNNYSTEAQITVTSGCVGLSLSTTLSYETGLGTPDDVISSYVTTKDDKVFVNVPEFVEKPFYDKRSYNISVPKGNTYHLTPQEDSVGGIQQFDINTEDFKGQEEVNFKISCSTCESESKVKAVAGTYFVPIDENTHVCSTTLIADNERILTLSDEVIAISDVDNACNELGGNMAIINTPTNTIESHLNAKYLQDLQRVWIYEDAQYFSYSLFENSSIKYESGLEYIDMFNRIEASLQKVTFCQPVNETLQKWQVGLESCGQDGWKEVFALFASNTSLPSYSPIYIHTSGDDWSSKLSQESTNNESTVSVPFYIPNFNVFVASESTEGCPTTALHYGRGWNLMETCSISKAYYSCQIEFTPAVESIACNSSQLNVSWPLILDNVEHLNKDVTITGGGFAEITVVYKKLFAVITGLTQRKTYNFNVTAEFGGCLEHSIPHTLVAKTSYGLADPVKNARIDSTSIVCTIVMPGYQTSNVLQYLIAAKSVLNTTYHDYKLPSSGSDKEMRTNISMEYHGNNERINLTIQAITCEGANNFEPVEGFCTSPKIISPTPIGAIIGSIFGVLAALALCAAGFVYYKKRRNSKSTENGPQQSALDDIYAVAVKPETSSFSKHLLFGIYLSESENGFQSIQEEFKKIQEESKRDEPLNDVSQLSENSTKNRYRNIYPMDHARVKLIGNLENDYINASYIAGYKNDRKFIASQGPKPTTIDDFWMMVWEQSSPIVVMLTGLKENAKTKCDQYWPELGGSATFGKCKINTLEENCFGDIIQRKFGISTVGEQRLVIQFHYIGWPDHGTPITTTSLFRLRKMVEENHDRENPIVVHCSAGVGRTGTYIAMDVLFDEMDNGGKANMKKCVLQMRKNRSEMVQNWKQYALVKKILVEYAGLPDSDKLITKLQRLSKAEINQLANREFATLKTWRYGEHWIPGNTNLTTYESNTVKVWSDRRQEVVTFNASYIESLKFGGNFIAMEYPAANQEEEFWRMLSMRKASVVVCLDESSPLQFSSTDQQFGDITLQFNDQQNEDGLSTHDALLWSSRQESFDFEVCVIQANAWKKKPPSANNLIKLIDKMQEMKAKKQGDFVVVCCKNGCDKTGTFIALVNILERLKSQNRVDVFRTIKDLRDMRPNMVDSLELYNYCYSVVLDYLSLFNAYENFSFNADEAKASDNNEPVYCNVPRTKQ